MIAAIYARKSTDDSDRNEDARSTTRQIERAREFAAKRGWNVAEEHVYADESVSGAEWKHRPAFNRLIAGLDPAPPFQVLIVSELSRIGRDTVRTPAAVLQIEDAGVVIWSYLSNQRISLADESSEIHTIFDSLAASFERRRASQRTRDAMRRLAERGFVTGGRCYGYQNERTPEGYVRRIVNEDEATVVRRVFEQYAAGVGMLTIAHRLNHEGVKPPRGRGWAPSAIREMLYRPVYRGEMVWGKLQKVARRGTRKQIRRDRDEWLTVPVPELRIISDELWQRVKARLDERAAIFPRLGKKLCGRPRFSDESAYLLVGFARCAVCGGAVGTDLRAHGSNGHRTHVPHYGCLDHKRRGDAVCTNAVGLRQDILDRAILSAITETLRPELLASAFQRAFAKLAHARSHYASRRGQIERELTEVQRRIDRLLDVLTDGALPADEIKARLGAEKTRKTKLTAELERLDKLAAIASVDPDQLKQRVQMRVTDVTAALGRQTVQARQMLRKLLADKIELEPVGSGRSRGYRFRGALTVEKLIGGDVFALSALNTSDCGGPNGTRSLLTLPFRGIVRAA